MTQRKWLAKILTEAVKKMHQQISYSYPSYKKFFSEVEGKTALAFWETHPSPYTLKDMSEEALAAFLRKHSNNGLSHKKANQILTLIDADGETYRDFQDSRDSVVVSQVESARFFQEQLVSIEGKIEHLMQQLGFQLESMTGINVVTAAQLVAEIGDIHRFSSSDKLARFAGIAPVIVGSQVISFEIVRVSRAIGYCMRLLRALRFVRLVSPVPRENQRMPIFMLIMSER
ncbi:IS110 family transposase [Paenibacillus sp. S150]|nr:IS110 family transposase [Paenibacillus sp. S150]